MVKRLELEREPLFDDSKDDFIRFAAFHDQHAGMRTLGRRRRRWARRDFTRRLRHSTPGGRLSVEAKEFLFLQSGACVPELRRLT